MTPSLDFAACAATAWQATPDMALRGGVAAGALALAAWAGARRFFAGRRAFVVMNLLVAGWITLSISEHAAADPACKGTLGLLSWATVLGQPMLWSLFLYQHLNQRPDAPTLPVRALLALPALVVLALCWTNGVHGWLYGPGSALTPPIAGLPRMKYDWGPVFYLAVALDYAWILLATALTLHGWRQADAGQREQRLAFAALMAVPLAANVAYVGFGWRLFGADPTSTGFAASGAGFAWLIARQQLGAVVPLARQRLFAELPDPVLVLDLQRRVVDTNLAAQRLVGQDPASGTPLQALPRLGAALAAHLGDAGPQATLQLQDPPASYTVQQRPLARRGRAVGSLVVLHDVTALQRAHDETIVNLAAREIQLRRATAAQAQLREQALRDPLTGLLNRRALEQRAAEGTPQVLVLMDLDHFKRINDRHGHAVGDAVLRDFSARLQRNLRADDALYRIGGEEFALLLPQADLAQAQRRVQALRELLARQRLGGLAEPVTFSAGLAAGGVPHEPLAQWLARADQALYRAKQGGRNRSEVA